MKLKAINTIIHDGKTHKPGAEFEAKDEQAEVLIAGGFAEECEAPAKPARQQRQAAGTAGDGN